MNWFEVWSHVLEAFEADADISEVMLISAEEGQAIFLDGERAFRVPSITALLVVDTEDELWAPTDWQFDIYTRTVDESQQVERAIRTLLNQPLPVTLNDAVLRSEYLAGALFRGPERDSYWHRRLEFRLTPARSRYYRPTLAGGYY